MIHIHAEGTEFDYFPARSVEAEFTTFNIESSKRTLELATGSASRLSAFKSHLPPFQRIPYWLVWQDKVDLVNLDDRAIRGKATSDDFVSSFRTIESISNCSDCGRVVSTLVVDAADPYPKASNLHREKVRRIRVIRCPYCGGGFRRLVVRIIEPS